MSWKNARTVSVFGHKVEQNLAAVLADAPGGNHCLTRLAST